MNTILKKHIVILTAYIGIAVVVLLGVSILLATMNSKVARVIEIKERLASYQNNKKAFDDESAQIKLLQNRLSVLESDVVTAKTVPNLLSTLESLAKKSNLSFEITSVQTPIDNEKTTLLVETTAKGSYDQVQSFFDDLQHQPFQTNITKLFIFSEQGEQSVPESAGTLSVRKTTPVHKDSSWQSVATIQIVSF